MNHYYLIGGLVAFLIAAIFFAIILKRFLGRLFKHIVILLIIAVAGSAGYIYRMTPRKNPAIGKHAYLKDNGGYLGVVEGEGVDNRRGDVWLIRPPGRYPVVYSKSRVNLKDKRDNRR